MRRTVGLDDELLLCPRLRKLVLCMPIGRVQSHDINKVSHHSPQLRELELRGHDPYFGGLKDAIMQMRELRVLRIINSYVMPAELYNRISSLPNLETLQVISDLVPNLAPGPLPDGLLVKNRFPSLRSFDITVSDPRSLANFIRNFYIPHIIDLDVTVEADFDMDCSPGQEAYAEMFQALSEVDTLHTGYMFEFYHGKYKQK